MSAAAGVLLLDKPAGPTSHDVVQWVRWALRERSVGHCGTLDPAATGLLVVCVGAATRFVEYLTGADKTYVAQFVLGVATDSGDVDGNVIAQDPVTSDQAMEATRALREMVGPLMLPPPALSAVKVDGRRAHARVRAGELVELDPRPMTILALSDVGTPQAGPEGTWRVGATLRVSKGSYIRSIALELGRRLGTPVHLGALRRTHSGPAALEDPACIGALEAQRGERGWRVRPHGIADRDGCRDRLVRAQIDPVALLPFPRLEVPELLLRRLAQGQRLSASESAFASVAEREGNRAVAAASGAPGLLVVVRHEHVAFEGTIVGRIAPEKVVRMVRASVAGPAGA